MEESDLIDMYLKNELAPEEWDSFTQRLQSDKELSKKVALRKLLIEGISQSYSEELKSKLIAFDSSLEGKKRYTFNWRVAASLAFVLISGAALLLYLQRPTYSDFDISESGLPNVMSESTNIDLHNGMNAFKNKDFINSGEIFNTLLQTKPMNDTLLYFSGLCDYRTKKTQTAIGKWKKIDSTSQFRFKTEYRLAIAYWSLGNTKESIELFSTISLNPQSPYQAKAKEALEYLH